MLLAYIRVWLSPLSRKWAHTIQSGRLPLHKLGLTQAIVLNLFFHFIISGCKVSHFPFTSSRFTVPRPWLQPQRADKMLTGAFSDTSARERQPRNRLDESAEQTPWLEESRGNTCFHASSDFYTTFFLTEPMTPLFLFSFKATLVK